MHATTLSTPARRRTIIQRSTMLLTQTFLLQVLHKDIDGTGAKVEHVQQMAKKLTPLTKPKSTADALAAKYQELMAKVDVSFYECKGFSLEKAPFLDATKGVHSQRPTTSTYSLIGDRSRCIQRSQGPR